MQTYDVAQPRRFGRLDTQPGSYLAASLTQLALFSLVFLTPIAASAQYKNTSFGIDAGYWLISKPSLLDEDGQLLRADRRPLRLSNGLRLGGETNVKMDEDHWWFNARINAGFLRFSESGGSALEQEYDRIANEELGTLFALQGSMGVRYVILTDRIRPYLQASISYLRLFAFTGGSNSVCSGVLSFCAGNETYSDAFLAHPNVGGLHFEPGLEIIITRDIAIRVFLDMQHWLLLNTTDNNALVAGAGFTFFG